MNNVGKILYGYCNGYFCNDSSNAKIIMFETDCSICCRYIEGEEYSRKGILTCANFDSPKEKQQYIDKWSKQYEEDDFNIRDTNLGQAIEMFDMFPDLKNTIKGGIL